MNYPKEAKKPKRHWQKYKGQLSQLASYPKMATWHVDGIKASQMLSENKITTRRLQIKSLKGLMIWSQVAITSAKSVDD